MLPSDRAIILAFVITATFDVLINVLPPPVGSELLRSYFSKHTVLGAALIAGFVGAITLFPIAALVDITTPDILTVVVIFLVSAFIGFPMQWSGIFPHLNEFYYGIMPRYQSFIADGLSGVMVASVYWLLTEPTSFPYSESAVLWTLIGLAYVFLVQKGIILYSPKDPITV